MKNCISLVFITFTIIILVTSTEGVSINFRNQTKNNFVNQFDRLNSQEIKTVVITTTASPSTSTSLNNTSTLCNIKVFKKLRLSWLDAFRVCKNIGNGTELVSIRSEADYQVLTEQIKNARSPVSVVYWTSGTDILDEGMFVWMSDGTEINGIEEESVRWARGQPDNFWETEHCVALRRTMADKEYKLSDENCLMSGAFICAQRCTS